MTLVVLLALAACTCAAISTVLKLHSTRRPPHGWVARHLPSMAALVANPMFAAAMVFDAFGIALQIAALRFGSLSVVQPILCSVLIISLAINHAVDRTRPSRAEIGSALLLVAGLVLFLAVSGAIEPAGEEAVGRLVPGIVLGIAGATAVIASVLGTRQWASARRARALAASVAIIYATTAGLMKSVTRIAALRGFESLLLSWQLWTLLVVAAAGLILNQQAFAIAPLHVSLPVTASLDPVLSVLIGVTVYGEALRSSGPAIAAEVFGLALLVFAVARLSQLSVHDESGRLRS